jgi:hypothetical protein
MQSPEVGRAFSFGTPARPQLSIDEEFELISQSNPQFAGLYLNTAGVPVVLNKGELLSIAMRSEIVSRVSLRSGAFDGLAVSEARSTRYSFAELASYRKILTEVVGSQRLRVGFGIDVAANRISIRGGQTTLSRLKPAAIAAGLPDDVLYLVIDSIVQGVSLRGVVRPVTGGLSISTASVASEYCSAGLQAWKNDANGNPDPSQGRFLLTASHCTGDIGAMTGVTFGQPHRGHGLHATEVWDAPLVPNCIGLDSCQSVDVAVLRMSDSVGSTWQRVAVSNTSNPPTYLGQLSLNTSIWSAVQGQPMRRVGARTGQRNGTVTHTCFQIYVAGRYILCNVEVKAYSDFGDSGGPVYTPLIAQYPGSPWRSGIYHSFNAPRTYYWFSSVGAIYAAFAGAFTI